MSIFKKNLTYRAVATFALIFILTIAAAVSTLTSPAVAETQKESYAYMSVTPKTVGLTQHILINAWTSPTPPLIGTDLSGFGQGRPRGNYTFTFIRPDGTQDIVIGPESYGDGTVFFTYLPNAIGNWSVTFYWPGDELFQPCTSPTSVFTVQQDLVNTSFPSAELPSEYWTQPVNSENRAWAQFVSDWRSSGYNATNTYFNPYDHGLPNTSHVLWTLQDAFGGISGSEFGDYSYSGGGPVPIVMAGRGYISRADGVHCIDIYTGAELWTASIPGTLFYVVVNPPDYSNLAAGGAPTIYASVPGVGVQKYDALTGALSQTISSPEIYGGITAYVAPFFIWFYSGNNTMYVWDPNWLNLFGGSTADFNAKVMIKVPYTFVPTFYVGGTDFNGFKSPGHYGVDSWGGIGLTSRTYVGATADTTGWQAAMNLTTGEVLWNETYDGAYVRLTSTVGYGKLAYPDINMRWHSIDISTGQEVWVSEPAEYPYGTFWTYTSATGNGKVYGGNYDGHMYAFDSETGKIAWAFYSGDSEGLTPYGTWPFFTGVAVGDGVVYASTTEHTPTQPMYNGWKLYCINDTTGTEIWSIQGMFNSKVLASDILFASNGEDGYLYAFGKGPSATSVSVTASQITSGQVVGITGTVTDQSPGQQNTPAVSLDSMTQQMEYLHMQQPKPTNNTGVPVILTATKSDGTTITIGSAVTDEDGIFRLQWTPETADFYKITAYFAGDDSYWGSQANTVLMVGSGSSQMGQTASPTTSPSQITQTNTPTSSPAHPEFAITGYVYGAIAAVVIVVVAVAAFVYIRRKK